MIKTKDFICVLKELQKRGFITVREILSAFDDDYFPDNTSMSLSFILNTKPDLVEVVNNE